MRTQSGTGRSKRSPRNILSLMLFALAVILFVVVAVLYVQDRDKKEPTAPPPSSVPGHAQLKNVYDALKAQGIDVQYMKTGGARIEVLSAAGQGLTVAGHTLYVFLFDDPATRESETTDLDPADPGLETITGDAIPAPNVHVISNSNVYAVLLGDSPDLIAKVDSAIQGMP